MADCMPMEPYWSIVPANVSDKFNPNYISHIIDSSLDGFWCRKDVAKDGLNVR